jgi:hypothetical protein
MGPEWKEWMAIREWVSNSIDEGNSVINKNYDGDVIGKQGVTRFYIEHVPAVKQVVDNWNNMFAYDRTDILYSTDKGRIYSQNNRNENMLLFRKGIRAYESNTQKSLFQYDMNEFHINESRLIDNLYAAGFKVVEMLLRCDNKKIIKKIIENCTKRDNYEVMYWESSLDYRWRAKNMLGEINEEWTNVLKERPLVVDGLADFYPDIVKKPHYLLNANLAILATEVLDLHVYGISSNGEELAHKPAIITKKMEILLADCLKFLKDTDYEVKYPIEIVEFNKTNTLGRAQNKTILLSEKVFSLGKKEIVATIIEENEHLKTGFQDCTREFQNHFINLYITEMEERKNLYL